MKRATFTFLAALGALSLCSFAGSDSATAQQAERIGTFGDWDAYTRGSGNNRFCYMVSKPKEASLQSRRGDIFFLVWHRPGNNEHDIVQVDIGYPFKDNSEVEVQIGGDSWSLFTRDESAWTYKTDDDKALVAALRKGARMTVKGVSSRGNPTTDTYSLKGTSAAYQAINRACGR
jgi:invasion protein IalB